MKFVDYSRAKTLAIYAFREKNFEFIFSARAEIQDVKIGFRAEPGVTNLKTEFWCYLTCDQRFFFSSFLSAATLG